MTGSEDEAHLRATAYQNNNTGVRDNFAAVGVDFFPPLSIVAVWFAFEPRCPLRSVRARDAASVGYV